MSDDAAAFDSACITWTSQLMIESIAILTQPWDASPSVTESPTIYHALKVALSVCPDYRRDDLKYFVPKEIYESAMREMSDGALLLNSMITEDPVMVAKSACRRGNSLAFLAARGIHRLRFTLDFNRFGNVRLSNITADNDEWDRFDALRDEWEQYLEGLISRSTHFGIIVYPSGTTFQHSLERDMLNFVCVDWQNEVALGCDFPHYHCVFDMTNWEMNAFKGEEL
jgi:hypothetical protein